MGLKVKSEWEACEQPFLEPIFHKPGSQLSSVSVLLKANCSFCRAAKRKHSWLLGESSLQRNLRTKTLNPQIPWILPVLSFRLPISLYTFLSLILLVSFFHPWEAWVSPSSSVWMEQLLLSSTASNRGWHGPPLMFAWVVRGSHRNVCFPNNYYSQWGSNVQGLFANVLQGLVASWWLLKQSTVRADGRHAHGLRRQDLILIHNRSHGLSPFSHSWYHAWALPHHPIDCHIPCLQHLSYQQLFFLF